MLDRSSGPAPKTLLGDGRSESFSRASRTKFVVSRSGRGGGSFLLVGRRSDGSKGSDEDSIATPILCL